MHPIFLSCAVLRQKKATKICSFATFFTYSCGIYFNTDIEGKKELCSFKQRQWHYYGKILLAMVIPTKIANNPAICWIICVSLGLYAQSGEMFTPRNGCWRRKSTRKDKIKWMMRVEKKRVWNRNNNRERVKVNKKKKANIEVSEKIIVEFWLAWILDKFHGRPKWKLRCDISWDILPQHILLLHPIFAPNCSLSLSHSPFLLFWLCCLCARDCAALKRVLGIILLVVLWLRICFCLRWRCFDHSRFVSRWIYEWAKWRNVLLLSYFHGGIVCFEHFASKLSCMLLTFFYLGRVIHTNRERVEMILLVLLLFFVFSIYSFWASFGMRMHSQTRLVLFANETCKMLQIFKFFRWNIISFRIWFCYCCWCWTLDLFFSLKHFSCSFFLHFTLVGVVWQTQFWYDDGETKKIMVNFR